MTSTTSKAAVDLRLAVRFEYRRGYDSIGDSSYAHVYADPVVIARGRYGKQEVSAWNVDSYEIELPEAVRALHGFRVSAQTDDRSRLRFYGYDQPGYALPEIPLRTAEKMLPVLRRLDRKLTDLNSRFGYPADLPAYLARVADALLPRGTVYPFVRLLTEGEPDFEGSGHRSMDADSLRMWLGDQVKAWCGYIGVPADAADGD
jgi:hypothetical protein